MNVSKLKKIHVIIIGSVACIAVAAGLYFLVISKVKTEILALEDRYTKAKEVADTLPRARRRLETAQLNYRVAVSELNSYMSSKMPPITFQDRTQGMIALWKEQAETLGPMLQSWPKKSGVLMLSRVEIPAAPTNPNEINPNFIQLQLNNFQVIGSFRKIMDHLRSWNRFGRLVAIGPPQLTGPSPGMTAEYPVTVYIFTYGEPGPNITMAGAGQGAGAGG